MGMDEPSQPGAVQIGCDHFTNQRPRGFRGVFPRPRLGGFDRSDRKFVAVARASAHGPMIVNAVDTDWWIYRVALQRHGVRVEFLCPDLMERG
jgi:hypothetical protein